MGNGKGGFLHPGRGILTQSRGEWEKGVGDPNNQQRNIASRDLLPGHTEIQRYRDTEIQRYRDTEIQFWEREISLEDKLLAERN